jgi:hypothetical protein
VFVAVMFVWFRKVQEEGWSVQGSFVVAGKFFSWSFLRLFSFVLFSIPIFSHDTPCHVGSKRKQKRREREKDMSCFIFVLP